MSEQRGPARRLVNQMHNSVDDWHSTDSEEERAVFDAEIHTWLRDADRHDAAHAALVRAAEMFLATLDDERGFDPYAAEERKEQLRAALERAKGE